MIPVAVLAMACQDRQPADDLKADLALIAAAQIELAPVGGGTMVVSAVENIPAPSPRVTPTPSKKRAPKMPPPQEVQAEAESDDVTATALEIVAVAPSEEPVAVEEPAPESAPAVRPQPIEPRYPIGGGTDRGTGRDRGVGNGGIGVGGGGIGIVIRGGRTGRDPCAIHDQRGRRPGIGVMINNRVPGVPTFPRY
jgi:hypothetical protein